MPRPRGSINTPISGSFRHEKRHYKRLDNIFPVEFQIVGVRGGVVSPWQQAFSQDISAGGLCLIANHLKSDDQKLLEDKSIYFDLRLHLPVGKENIIAKGKVAWFKKTDKDTFLQYAIGIEYAHIEPQDNVRILRYCLRRKVFKNTALILSFILSASLVVAGLYNARLKFDNEKLLNNLSMTLQNQHLLQEDGNALAIQINDIKGFLENSQKKSLELEAQLKTMRVDDQKKIADLQLSLELLNKSQGKLKDNLADLALQKIKADSALVSQEKKVMFLEKQVRDKLYSWLINHRNNRTGLVVSFEGDEGVEGWGFTYDEALAVMNFVNSGDLDAAEKVLDFYTRAQRIDGGGIANAYYASSGEPAEFIAHVGPNVWLGLAIMQYTFKTRDSKYLPQALNISHWLDTVKDEEGGLRGGKNITWYSTEHNLDAYAFYKMLYVWTKQEDYEKRSNELLAWLSKNAYSNIPSPVIKRGKGDSTIATDTYAWSISAIGPQVLKNIGMDPDAILEFAIENCSVSVEYSRPDGTTVKVKGFDFAKHQNLPRGGVISCEWSAQMSLAFKQMAQYHGKNLNEQKSGHYARMSQEYISELSKMMISSPSPVGQGGFCLPYASHEFVDTGHGWRTPHGNRTGSVAATAYTIFAIDGFNPLKINE